MIGRWADITKQEGKDYKRQEEPRDERRMSDKITHGITDMQEAIQAVKQLSFGKRQPERTTRSEEEDDWTWTKEDRNNPRKLKEIISIGNESFNGERLYKLTELGLNVDAAKQLKENEEEIADVHRMLEEKRKKEKFNKQKGRDSETTEGESTLDGI